MIVHKTHLFRTFVHGVIEPLHRLVMHFFRVDVIECEEEYEQDEQQQVSRLLQLSYPLPHDFHA